MYAVAERLTPRPLWPRLVREAAPDAPPWDLDLSPDTSARAPAVAAASEPSSSTPDPDDELFLLGERCAEAYMRAEALHYRALQLLAEFHGRQGWRGTGFASTAEWLAWRVGLRLNAARERVRTALALERLPLTARAMEDGELSFTKVRALTRVARPDNEATLLAFARAGSAANLERVVRGWRALEGRSELSAEEARHRSRRFRAWVDTDGMVVVQGRLDPEVGAVLMRAVEAAGDALYRDGAEGGRGGEVCACGAEGRTEEEARAGVEATTPEQRRADAVGLMAERALAAGFGGRGEEGDEKVDREGVRYRGNVGEVGNPTGAGDGDEADLGRARWGAPISGTRAERYQVMLHVEAEALSEDGEAGLSELEDGTRVTAVTSRRIACDAGVVRIARGGDGQVMGAGRRSRTVPPALRRALEARDRGCRFPGCGLRFTDAHHVRHWADGGETRLDNLVLLCRRHHRAVHEGGVRVCIDRDGQVVFFSPRGTALLGAPPARTLREWDRGLWDESSAPSHRPSAGVDKPQATPARARASEPHAAPQPRGAPTNPFPGAAAFTRDSHIPWPLEAAAREALDPG